MNVHAALFKMHLPNFSILSLYSRSMGDLALDGKITEVHLGKWMNMHAALFKMHLRNFSIQTQCCPEDDICNRQLPFMACFSSTSEAR